MICSCGFWSMQSPVEHLPISYASNFIQMVLPLLASSSWIVSGHPVTGSKSFPEIVASWWLMFTMCDGRATLGATTGVDSTLGGRTWWYVLDWGDMWMAWSSILATSAKSLRTGGPKFRGEIALHLEFFKRYNMLAWIWGSQWQRLKRNFFWEKYDFDHDSCNHGARKDAVSAVMLWRRTNVPTFFTMWKEWLTFVCSCVGYHFCSWQCKRYSVVVLEARRTEKIQSDDSMWE